MARLPACNWIDIVAAFAKVGWRNDRTRGSHYIMTRKEEPGLLSIPMHNPVKRGTLRSLIRQAGLSVNDFAALL